jgi:hypothetical protein
MNQFPPPQSIPIRQSSNFFKNSQRYLQVKVHHRYQRQIFATSFASVVDTGGKFATGVNDTVGK